MLNAFKMGNLRLKYTDNKNYRLDKLSDNILYVNYLNDCELEIQTVQDMIRIGKEMMGYKKYFSLININKTVFGSISPEAKDFLASSDEAN